MLLKSIIWKLAKHLCFSIHWIFILDQGGHWVNHEQVEVWTKMAAFCRQLLKHFFKENYWSVIQILLNSVPKVTSDNKSALVQVMAWHHKACKMPSLSTPMTTKFTVYLAGRLSLFYATLHWHDSREVSPGAFPVEHFCELVRLMDTGRIQNLLCVPESESCPLKIRAYFDTIRLA